MQRRRRSIRHEKATQERLAEELKGVKDGAEIIPFGTHRELLRRTQQSEAEAHLEAYFFGNEGSAQESKVAQPKLEILLHEKIMLAAASLGATVLVGLLFNVLLGME